LYGCFRDNIGSEKHELLHSLASFLAGMQISIDLFSFRENLARDLQVGKSC
jgi:hypothetical protein